MKIYCSGIGGMGLSAYAAFQHASGHTVLGSDKSQSVMTDHLREQGIEVFFAQDGSSVPDDIHLFVYSEAIPKDAPERIRAKDLGVKQLSYFQALGELSKEHTVIAVCGTHGKTSTTGMAAVMLMEENRDPSVIVGSNLQNLQDKNWHKGNSELFVLEACEYRGSFHALSPDIILMTNVDGDHFDSYGSIEEYQNAYVDFLKQLPADGVVITHMSDPECSKVALESGKTIVDADQFDIENLRLQVPGAHMKQNAQLVQALASHLQVSADGTGSFTGAARRMEEKGKTANGAIVIDDYAHHPKEISATIAAVADKYAGRNIVCVFQPHTHDRTKHFYKEFTSDASGWSAARLVIIPNVYDARPDIEHGEVSIDQFVSDIEKGTGALVMNGHSLNETKKILDKELLETDILLVMGAGDVTRLADEMVA